MSTVDQIVTQCVQSIFKTPPGNKSNLLFFILSTPVSIFDAPDLGLGFQFIDTADHLVAEAPDGYVYANEKPIKVSVNHDDSLNFYISMKCNTISSPTLKCTAEIRIFMLDNSNKFSMLKSVNGCAATMCILGTDVNNFDIPILF